MNSDPYLTPYTKINSRQILELNLKVNTIKLFEENTSINLNNLRFGNDFIDTIPKAQASKHTHTHTQNKDWKISGQGWRMGEIGKDTNFQAIR